MYSGDLEKHFLDECIHLDNEVSQNTKMLETKELKEGIY